MQTCINFKDFFLTVTTSPCMRVALPALLALALALPVTVMAEQVERGDKKPPPPKSPPPAPQPEALKKLRFYSVNIYDRCRLKGLWAIEVADIQIRLLQKFNDFTHQSNDKAAQKAKSALDDCYAREGDLRIWKNGPPQPGAERTGKVKRPLIGEVLRPVVIPADEVNDYNRCKTKNITAEQVVKNKKFLRKQIKIFGAQRDKWQQEADAKTSLQQCLNRYPDRTAPRPAPPKSPPKSPPPATTVGNVCGMESRAALKQARDEAAKSARWLDKQHADNDKLWHDSNAFVAYRQGKLDKCRDSSSDRKKLLCGSIWEPELIYWTNKRDGAQARTEMYYTSWYVQADKRNAMDYCLAGKQPRVKYCGYKSEAALAKRAGQLRALLKKTKDGSARLQKYIDDSQTLADNSKFGLKKCNEKKDNLPDFDNMQGSAKMDAKQRWYDQLKVVWSPSKMTDRCAQKNIISGGKNGCKPGELVELCIRDYTAEKKKGNDEVKYKGWELAGLEERVTYIEPELARLYACGAPDG